jgi:replicative DNA helicase
MTTVPVDSDAGGRRGDVPPQDLDAEQSVLGGMLLSKDAIGDVVEIVKGADFYRPAHETIFNAITSLYGEGEPADPITVAAELRKRGELAKVGDTPYVHGLVNAVPTASNAAFYAEIVAEKAALRRLVVAGTRIAQLGHAGDGEVAQIQDAAGAELQAALQVREESETRPVGDRYGAYIERLDDRQRNGKAKGIPWGLMDLDLLTNGLHPGQMIIIAARPAIGKSTLALDVARSAAVRCGHPTAIFSLEMGEDEVLDRLTSAEARVGLHKLRAADLTQDDWEKVARVLPRINAAPLYLDFTATTTVMEIKAKCRRLQQRTGLDLIIIDYLQLLQTGRRAENRQVEVSEMSRSLKLLAKDLNVPVIVLSQLNRGPEQRADHKPLLSDLRESGSLEQDADVVILLSRDDAYDKTSPRSGEADVLVAKHRGGPTAEITVAAQLHYSRFVDMAAERAS